MVHGFGHTSRALRSAYGKGASDAQLITRYAVDPLMGGTGMNVNFVTIEQAGLRPMARFGMVIDTRSCVGCMDCVVACKTENDVPDGFYRDWINQALRGQMPNLRLEITLRALQPLRRPPCVACCPTGASHVDEFGKVVLVDHDKCIGCKACLAACPYGARFIHPDGYADKCTFCIHRVKRAWTRPAWRCARPAACISATSTTRSRR